MSGRSKAFGLLLIVAAIAAFMENFGLYHFWIIGSWDWFWNPIVYFFGTKIVGNIWIISDVGKGLITLGYSGILFVIGAFALLKS